MKPIIEVCHLWKQYQIGGERTSYLSLRERLTQPFRSTPKEHFWALKDINFEVYEGECVGIVGRNGAGKSTLLKILSQITPPTKGHILARGRIASLLEVGTGFHPELTGRENVYLNGSILGLRKTEIDQKFDEIVAFSGVERFLDTPLKHYSSGMKLRLAFSVAAHLEPEILLIDEVLAVGDAEFQKKCLGKMDEVSKSGRTVLFVSHNLGAVKQLCGRGVLLEGGEVRVDETIDRVIKQYQQGVEESDSNVIVKRHGFSIKRIEFFNKTSGESFQTSTFISGDSAFFKIIYSFDEVFEVRDFHIGLAIYNNQNQFITVLNNKMSGYSINVTKSNGAIECHLGKLPFMYGRYQVLLTAVINGEVYSKIENALSFYVEEGDFYTSGFSNAWKRNGIYVNQIWKEGEEIN